jgi:hypothetical protein
MALEKDIGDKVELTSIITNYYNNHLLALY